MSNEPQIQTRQPTGRPAWPLFLVEGPEKAGKTYLAAELTTARRFSRAFWIDWGEGSADEAAALPGADYEIVIHDGTFNAVARQIVAIHRYAKAQQEAGEPPVLLVVDSMTAEWETLKDEAQRIAMDSPFAQRKLERDPGADIPIPGHAWNKVKDKHAKLMKYLMAFPGIVVMTARGKEVTAYDDNGKPKEGVKDYKVESHKTLAYDASCVIRMSHDVEPQIMGLRKFTGGVQWCGKGEPLDGRTLESVAFDMILDGAQPEVRDVASEPELETRNPEPEPEPEQHQTAEEKGSEQQAQARSEFSEEANANAEKVLSGLRDGPTDKLPMVREWAMRRCGEDHPVITEIDAETQRRQQPEPAADQFDWEGAIEDAKEAGNLEDLYALREGAPDERVAGIARAAINEVNRQLTAA